MLPILIVPALALMLDAPGPAAAPSDEPLVDLVVQAGRPLRVALDRRTRVRGVGQLVSGTLVEPVYAHDRIVAPAGTKVLGHVARLQKVSRGTRLRAILRGDFTPLRHAILEFDSLVLEDCREIPIETEVQSAIERLTLRVTVGAGWNERLAVDDEGGVTVTSSKKRFVAPALTTLAFGLTMHRRLDYDTGGLGPDVQYGTAESTGIGGFFGLGLLGTGLSQLSRPTAVGLGVLGIARTTYAAVFGKGREVSFPAHTIMEVQLGPEPSPAR